MRMWGEVNACLIRAIQVSDELANRCAFFHQQTIPKEDPAIFIFYFTS